MEERNLPHALNLKERRELTMTGVTEVVRFDESEVMLRTSLGTLLIHGQDLKLRTLSLNGGQVAVEGEIAALIYEEPRASGWRRFFA